ncbi:MAG: glycoside hydrolase family 57 protein [Candidatus Caenarcaniphilales bacterium]|nr:glycoside hydrolase family 57 protein [Candidatus Caenarcaniphilales bacterium]
MVSVCFYFQVHQPERIRDYKIFDIGNSPFYLDDKSNELIMKKVANRCYLPMTKLLKRIIRQTKGEFKCTFSFSGIFLEQAEKYCPEVIEAFQELVATGSVEILSETYYHTLAFLYNSDEWKEQIKKHKEKIEEVFGITPTVFRNTELIYSDKIGEMVAEMGYKGILAEGVDANLGWRSPNYLYNHATRDNLKLLLKNYKLSDDIAFRFSNKTWGEWPLTTDKFTSWLDEADSDANVVNLFMDFETFGEHQWDESGIFEFMRYLPEQILKSGKHNFIFPSEAIELYTTVGSYSSPEPTSWADKERDLSAWKSNPMQLETLEKLYSLEKKIKATFDKDLIEVWRKLTVSDHFYYMSTKNYSDGDVHSYFSPYDSPYDAYIVMSNVLADLEKRVEDYFTPKKSSISIEAKPLKEITLESLRNFVSG